MNRILFECFDCEGEVVSFASGGGSNIEISFTKEVDGYLCIGRLCERIKGKSCVVDMTAFPNEEYTPRLILDDKTVILPTISKDGRRILPIEYDITHIRVLSLKEKRNESRIAEMEKRIKEMEKKIYGSTIF